MPELSVTKSVLLTDLAFAVNRYRTCTPGIYVCLHVPVLLDDETRFVPGLIAMVNHGRLRQCAPQEHGFVGPPNFVLDVFDSSELDEFELRRAAFGRFGVTEYVAIIAGAEAKCYWNRHNGAEFENITPDDNGVIKSMALPGLWFSTTYQDGCNGWGIVGQIETGVTRLGHHEFMETIWHKNGRDPDLGDWMPFDSG